MACNAALARVVAQLTPYEQGVLAAQAVRARGVPVSAMIKGVFHPNRGQEHAADAWGTFRVMRGSMPECEEQMPHSHVQDFWRGFVAAFDA